MEVDRGDRVGWGGEWGAGSGRREAEGGERAESGTAGHGAMMFKRREPAPLLFIDIVQK